MLGKVAETKLREEFDRQAENLIQKGYPEVAGLTAEEFLEHIEPLKERIKEVPVQGTEAGRIPFVIVVKSDLVATDLTMPLVSLKGKEGFIGMHPVEPARFQTIEGLEIPDGMAYLLGGIDTGKDTLNVTPDDALKIIEKENRSPLTIDEGVALVTHYPEILRTQNCFSLLGSRRGDRRVTALWISKGKPRLGWCWAGNPHTWLGSASCGTRIGR